MRITITSILFAFLTSIFGAKIESPEYEKKALIELMSESKVIAGIISSTTVYKDMSENSTVVTVLPPESCVEIIREYSGEWYFISDVRTGKSGWVLRKFLDIPPDTPPNPNHMDKSQLEGYVNVMGFESSTAYFVLTDIDRQVTHIFKGKKHDWQLLKTLSCSTGKNESPTLRGEFKLQTRGIWFYSERLKSGAKFWVRFEGQYLFHSIPMDKSGNVIDDTIGIRNSSGCVRFNIFDAEWFYKNVPDKTSVLII